MTPEQAALDSLKMEVARLRERLDDLKTLPKPQDSPPHIRPREAAVETTPTPVAWAVESGRGIEGLYVLQSVACDRATHWGEECRVFPLYAAPVAIPAEQPPKPSGVNFAFALAADVVRCVEQIEKERHDAATCRGERQEPAKPVEIDGDKPDVGEGWEELGPDDILRDGDEVIIEDTWLATASIGRQVGALSPNRYRRRVTPVVPPAPQSRPAETRASASRDALIAAANWQAVNEALAAEQEEVKRLRSEVERLKKSEAALRAGLANLRTGLAEAKNTNLVDYIDALLSDAWRQHEEIEELRSEVERLRDLVRHQRGELYEADLISDEEYANLVVTDGKASVARLHTYDDLRFENANLKAEVERLRLELISLHSERQRLLLLLARHGGVEVWSE